MARTRRPFGGFDDFFDFDDVIRHMFDDLKDIEFPEDFREGEPIVYGVNVRMGPEGKPVVSQFGNVEKGKVKEEREPLVDIIEEKDAVRVIIELPGVEKGDINLDAAEQSLRVNVTNPEHRFVRTIALPVKVDEKTAKATCKNGILEVVMARREPGGERPEKIKIT